MGPAADLGGIHSERLTSLHARHAFRMVQGYDNGAMHMKLSFLNSAAMTYLAIPDTRCAAYEPNTPESRPSKRAR